QVQELVTAQQELYSVGYRICQDFVLTWTLN
ncbi:siderophore biosynthesis protein, partial [Bacteroides ovatus]